MAAPEFTNTLWIVAIGFACPLILALVPGFKLPAVVLELIAGILVGPDVLGWVSVDDAVNVLSVLGLTILLFLAGLELEFDRLRGALLRLSIMSFAVSFAIALVAAFVLHGVGATGKPLFVAIVLSATSLGVMVPVLKDSGLTEEPMGQLLIAAASIADIATIVLLSLLFSEESASIGVQIALIGALALLGLTIAFLIRGAERSKTITSAVDTLAGTTAEIRVRGAFLLLVTLAVAADQLGLEVILGAFIAGAILSAIDPERHTSHPEFRLKLNAIGYGIFIPIFFVASGLNFDLHALTSHPSALIAVPLMLLGLLLARGLPALLYRGVIPEPRRLTAAALLQSTSLPFIVAATQIGVAIDVLSPANAASLVAAGLLSVLIFPLTALTLLKAEAGTSPRSYSR